MNARKTGNRDRAAESGSDRKHLTGHEAGQLIGATKAHRCTNGPDWHRDLRRSSNTTEGEGMAESLGTSQSTTGARVNFSFRKIRTFAAKGKTLKSSGGT